MTPFPKTPDWAEIPGGQHLTHSTALSPHLNLELALGIGIRTLKDPIKPVEEIQNPNDAN